MRELRGWWREFAGLVLPVACGGCGRPRAPSGVCEACAGALYGGRPGRVRPAPEPPGLPAVHAAARYEDAPRAVLLAHKERGALGLARPLGAALAGAVRSAVRGSARGGVGGAAGAVGGTADGVDEAVDGVGGAADRVTSGAGVAYPRPGWVHGPAVDAIQELVLVPVPSARRSVGARGHDAARRIARAAAAELRRTGTPARVAPVLRQRRTVDDQAGLSARERLVNLSGALEVVAGGRRLLAGGRVVLVDDLMTTGASLVEAARALAAPDGLPERAVRGRRVPGWGSTGRRPGNTRIRGPVAAVVAAPPISFEINWN
ncbi:ComF family protein [Streptomyces sp. NPDC048442]|uniref:ComF family protein n=1 Tax=Streptomyces sp. NPDC048442 TaxID=3154823 RepID=UPI0034465EF1